MKYLYIDERKDAKQAVQSFIIDGELDIEDKQPTKKRKDIIEIIKNYDGLIIDQQLDEEIIEDENGDRFFSDYYGSSLAMDIRTKENEIKQVQGLDISIPIVLYSADKNVPDILSGLGKDIFDLRIYKADSQFMERIPEYKKEILSLAKGYEKLKKVSNILDALNICSDLCKVDNRFLGELKKIEKKTAHVKATFILNELIIKQGILIDEDILAVRLGIDKKKSKDWSKVIDSLTQFKADYRGVFCDGWSRWWMPMVEEWWSNVIEEESYLQFITASQRANIISKKLNVKLVAAIANSKFSINDDYWTVCDFSKEPLSVEDGLLLPSQDNLYPWQDAKYVSIMSALEESLVVADSEKEKLKYYTDLLSH